MAYRIGQVCAQTGLSAKQLRDWERRGIVRPSRGTGNQRTYDPAAIERLRHAKRMHDAGLSLADVKQAFAIAEGSEAGGDAKAAAHVRLILARMHRELELADELAEALRVRLTRKSALATRP